jgi:acyl-CoA dehydrogenase
VVVRADAQVREAADLAGDARDDVDLTGVRVGTVGVVGAEAEQQLALRAALGTLLLTSGAAQEVLDSTVRHVQGREQFGRPIGRFQAVQQELASLAGEVTALQIGVDAAVRAVESGAGQAWLLTAGAKVDADRSVTRLTTIAHQLHGAIGVTHEHALRRWTLRLWSWRDDGGAAAQWAAAIGARVLAPEAPALWQQVVGD